MLLSLFHRPRLIVAIFAISVAGCVQTQTGYVHLTHKLGSNSADRGKALDMCQFEAIKAVPRALSTTTKKGYSDPGTLQCSTIGTMTSCNRVGAFNTPSTSTTTDANVELRDRYTARCLERAGYAVFKKPLCQTESGKQKFRASIIGDQPPASDIPCVIYP